MLVFAPLKWLFFELETSEPGGRAELCAGSLRRNLPARRVMAGGPSLAEEPGAGCQWVFVSTDYGQ